MECWIISRENVDLFLPLHIFKGWTYAMDFPAEYSASKKFTSCVRRRKWIRYRKYIAMDSWSSVPGIGEDSCPLDKSQFFKQKPQSSVEQEPFLDLAIGGNEIPGTLLSTLESILHV